MSQISVDTSSLANILATWSVPSMVLKTVLELDILEIIKSAGPGGHLSPVEIADQLPTTNPDAAGLIDRLLRLLASFGVLTFSVRAGPNGGCERLYGLSPVCELLTKNEDGVSLAALAVLIQDEAYLNSWGRMKDAILEGGTAFNKAHGMGIIEYLGKDASFRELFYSGMKHHSTLVMKKILEEYQGFEGLSSLVDVGGATGDCMNMIVSKYPTIKSINFDLPHVIRHAPSFPGVEHVEGNMYESIPKAEAIFLKWILHGMSDEQCIKLLTNCHSTLPKDGKVILCEYVVPEVPEASHSASTAFIFDVIMLAIPGGKERTKQQYEALGKEAGFEGFQLVCSAYDTWVIEFLKKN